MVVVAVVVVVAVPVVLILSNVAFPAAPVASPDVLVTSELAFPAWCLPFAAAAASEWQQRDLYQPVEGLVEDSSLVVVG